MVCWDVKGVGGAVMMMIVMRLVMLMSRDDFGKSLRSAVSVSIILHVGRSVGVSVGLDCFSHGKAACRPVKRRSMLH